MEKVELGETTIKALAQAIVDAISQPERLVNIDDLSKAIDTPKATIYNWVSQKRERVPHYKHGQKGGLRFKVSEVYEYLRRIELKKKASLSRCG